MLATPLSPVAARKVAPAVLVDHRQERRRRAVLLVQRRSGGRQPELSVEGINVAERVWRSYESDDCPGDEKVVYHEIDYTPLNRVNGDDGVHSSIDDLRKRAEALHRPLLVSRKTLRLTFTPGTLNSGIPTDYGFSWAKHLAVDLPTRNRGIGVSWKPASQVSH